MDQKYLLDAQIGRNKVRHIEGIAAYLLFQFVAAFL